MPEQPPIPSPAADPSADRAASKARGDAGIVREVYREDRALVAEVPAIAWVSATKAAHLISPHAHAELFEIAYFVRGSADWWIERQDYHVTAGQVFITKPGERHGARDEMFHPHEHWQIQIRPSAAPSDFIPGPMLDALAGLQLRCFAASPATEDRMRRILLEHKRPQAFSTLAVRAALCELLVGVVRDHGLAAASVAAGRHCPQKVRAILEWIDASLAEIESTTDIAEQAGMSVRQFHRLFRQELNVSPNEYLVERRVEAAKRLLADASLSVTEIAFRVGFSSSQYFSTVFKAVTGITPSRFRDTACGPRPDAAP